MFTTGHRIGAYTLVKKLGKGGFGEVWLAERQSKFFTKKVAIKLPHDEQVDFETVKREAQLWEEASGHPNVLPIIDADVYDGQVVIVSEYADGGSLADKIKETGNLPIEEAVRMCIGILNGLDFLHHRKIIHRDIKPQNILLQGNTPRLADFGISRAMNTSTISSVVVGTDSYMAPESFDGKRSVQTDIWSVGVVLYQLLKGALPFPQEHPSERMFAVLTKEFEPLPDEIPPDLRRIVQTALSKTPENRFHMAADMSADLQKVLVNISHPTYAPTEVLYKPASIEIPRETLQEQAQDKSAVTETPPYYYIPPTQAVINKQTTQSNETHATPISPNRSLPTEIQYNVNAKPGGNKNRFSFLMLAVGVAGGIVFFGIIALLVVYNDFSSKENSGYTNYAVATPTATGELVSTSTEAEAQTLVKNTMSDFADAIETGNFDTFRGNASKEFQTQFSDAQIKSTFKAFTDQKEDVLPILRDASKMNAKFSPLPAVREEKGYSILVTKGTFKTTPVPVKFSNEYVYQDGEWKLLKIQINL